MTRRGSFWVGVLVAIAAAAPARLFACAACFGQSDSAMAAGMNWGILSLLGMIVVVLGGVAGFFVFLARRSATVGPLQPVVAIAPATPEKSWSSVANHEETFDAEILASRSSLKQAAALAQPRHLCAPVRTPRRASVPRKRA